MAVLDPFEVRSITVWPLPAFQTTSEKAIGKAAVAAAVENLNALERTVFLKLVSESAFGKILNEKDPPDVPVCDIPPGISGEIVSEEVRRVRQHPDLRIARRAQTIARLSQIIAGRDVQVGLRRALATQADRLAWIANQRFAALGGEAAVEERAPDDMIDDEDDDEQAES